MVMVRERPLKNWGNSEVQPLLSCLRVRYTSNVDTISGSSISLAIRLKLFGSSSYSTKTVQPRMPHGSRSDTRTMSLAMRWVRSLGNETSVQVRLRVFAARSSPSRRCESSFTAAASMLSQSICSSVRSWWCGWCWCGSCALLLKDLDQSTKKQIQCKEKAKNKQWVKRKFN